MLTHISKDNQPTMVDISNKEVTTRSATAETTIILGPEIMAQLTGESGTQDLQSKKGPVFQTAIIAGTMAVKRTADLIPFCHPIPLEKCKFQITPNPETHSIHITCTCQTTGKTGIEMEALTGASIAALTIYDMTKALSHEIEITQTQLLKKTGGKSNYTA